VFKKIVFQLHWLLGISAGLMLSIMGITGALYAFEGEIVTLLNPDIARVQVRAGGMLAPATLIEKLETETGGKVSFLRLNGLDDSASQVFLAPRAGALRGTRHYLDPYTGALLEQPRGQAFFQFVLDLHRRLTLGASGRQITGASTLALLFFCVSGLYLRWPRQALHWRTWLIFDWAKKGRAFHWDLHAVAGTWALVFYLCMALTGLYWSYPWYRQGLERLLGDAPAQTMRQVSGAQRLAPAVAPPNVAAMWQGLLQAVDGQPLNWTLRIPANSAQPFTISYLLADAAHPRAFNRVRIDAQSGRILSHERYTDKRFPAQILASMYALHTGEYWGLPGRILMLLASLGMPIFFITGWLLYLDRRRKQRAVKAARAAGGLASAGRAANMTLDADAWLIGFASQSGFAEQLAWQTAGQLQAANVPVQVQPLAQLDEQQLRSVHKALFVISTFGNGEAPDSARGFERKLLTRTLRLSQLRYAVLALGDRQYEQFCGFARRVHDWLGQQGAQSLLAPVEVDGDDHHTLGHWHAQVSHLTGAPAQPLALPAWEPWILTQRMCLNPGSQGAPTYWLALESTEPCHWDAGDILQVLPEHPERKTLQAREYSIASIPEDGALELIVRQEQRSDGRLGVASGLLTQSTRAGEIIWAKIKRNNNFHAPPDDRPMVLIGNGVGLAGLRALLKARTLAGHTHNWLLFGERNRAHDFYRQTELHAWLENGDLQHLDTAFSRDQVERIYVQDRLREHSERLQQWVAQGASIYVCGSLQGMADGVDAVLRAVLGDAQVAHLTQEGRYRRDVF